MVIEVKEFLVTNRYDTNTTIEVDNIQYLVLECNQYIPPKEISKKSVFVIRCVVIDLVKRV